MWIQNARLVGDSKLQHLRFDEHQQLIEIQEHAPGTLADSSFDLEGDWLSLGGVDIQINGALGLAFPDLEDSNVDQLNAIGQFLWEQGVNAYLPTIVTTAIPKLHSALRSLSEFKPASPQRAAKILGAHLEGPCLNPQKRGAHPQVHLLPLSPETLEYVLGEFSNQVALMTLAPELDPDGTSFHVLRHRNIRISLGHSLATAEQAEQAFHRGATMVTHAFNAMPPLHHRHPGLLAIALLNPSVWCGVIADGQHVVPTMLKLLIQASTGLFLVSDALSPLGLPDGIYPWDDREITIEAGTARLPDGTLAGTTHPLLTGVQNLVRWGCCQPEQAIALATEAPRQALGLPGIKPGCHVQEFLRWTLTDPQTLTWKRLSLDE